MTSRRLLGCMVMLLVLGGIAGCGSNDPYSLLHEANVAPILGLPAASTVISGNVGAYTSSSGGFDYLISPVTSNVVAPEAGVIGSVDSTLDSGFVAVTIFHNSRLSTRIRKLSAATAMQVGRSVVAGEAIGTPGITGLINMSVIVDGSLACPLSLMTSDARVFLSGRFAVFPCQI